MPERIPQSKTLRVPLKVFLSSDHVSVATGKTVAITVSKNGAAFGNPSAGATNATELSAGWYYVDLSTADTGTQGPLIIRGTNAASDDAEAVYDVVDAHNAGLDALPSAASGSAGAVPTTGTGANQLAVTGGGVTLADGAAHGGTPGSSTATLALAKVNVTNDAGEDVVLLHSTQPGGSAVHLRKSASGGWAVNAENVGGGTAVAVYGDTGGVNIDVDNAGTSGAVVVTTDTAGSAVLLRPTSGHGVDVAASGAGKHGLFVAGGTGGTSDGARFVAGAGGVDLRAAVTGNVTGNLSGSVGSVTGNVGGNVTGSVGSVAAGGIAAASFAAGAIDAAAIAADAIGASEMAAGAVTKIQAGLSTLTAAQVNAEADTALADVGLTSTVTGRIDVAVGTRSTYAGGAVASVTAPVAVASLAAGAVTTASIADGAVTDAKFTVPAEAAGPPAGFMARLMWLTARLGLRRVRRTPTAVETYLADGTTVMTTQAYTTGTTDDVNAAI
jgi:hypothetical protein